MKKVLSVLLAVLMMLSLSSVSFAAGNSKNGNLQFDEDGKFEILLFADTQDGYPHEKDFLNFMNQALDKAQPDLVIFLGDIVMGAETDEEYWKGYDELLAPLVERDIPFTLVFGNHDDQDSHKGSTRDEKFAKYLSFENCVAYDADAALHGAGTHNLEILSSDGTKTAYNLWMMDSGDYVPEGGYDCVRADQLEWYKGVSKQLEADNGGKVPSLMFQHIVPAEVAKEVMFTVKGDLGDLASTNFRDGTAATYLPNIFAFEEGWMFEQACPSRDCEGQWDAITERGDVNAVFFGHDHINTYVANINGIDAVNVPGSTYSSYYNMISQGAMLVTLDEKTGSYEREMLYTSDLALEEGSELPNGEYGKAYYWFAGIFRGIIKALVKTMQIVLFPFFFWA